MKYGERFIPVLFQQRIDVGKPGLGKMRDKLAEFRVELRLDPRHIFALRTDARFHARNAVRKRQIEKKYRNTLKKYKDDGGTLTQDMMDTLHFYQK